MDKFLELAFRNQIRNNDNLVTNYEKLFEPIMESLRDKLSESACDEIEEMLIDSRAEALMYAGVLGMEFAIGVMNGTIEQVIE